MKAVCKITRGMSVQGASYFTASRVDFHVLYMFPCQHTLRLLVTVHITFATNCIPSVSFLFPLKIVYLLIRVVSV